MQTIAAPARNPSVFELASWDGMRWQLEGIFESNAEASAEAKQLLGRRQAVKVTEEYFNEKDGLFKSRVVLTEYRDGARPVRSRPRQPPPAQRRVVQVVPPAAKSTSNDLSFYFSCIALVVSLASLFLVIVGR
jgi:hypothetical protein